MTFLSWKSLPAVQHSNSHFQFSKGAYHIREALSSSHATVTFDHSLHHSRPLKHSPMLIMKSHFFSVFEIPSSSFWRGSNLNSTYILRPDPFTWTRFLLLWVHTWKEKTQTTYFPCFSRTTFLSSLFFALWPSFPPLNYLMLFPDFSRFLTHSILATMRF